MIGNRGDKPSGRILGFTWTPAVATKRIRALAAKSGVIGLADAVRTQISESGPTHPQLGRLLRAGTVREKPRASDDGAHHCVVEGLVPDAARGARVGVTIWKDRLYVTSVEWS